MKISAVIAEFNPLHQGHKHLINTMRKENDAVVAIMSGNFVQRGECSVYDKTERTRAALNSGVDLVLELPCVYALSSAEGFAKGAVETLSATGITNSLYFGSECGDIDALTSVAKDLNNESSVFKTVLDHNLREGKSYPAARLCALKETNPNADILSSPNNTLAVEYIRVLDKINSGISPCTLKRIGGGYNDSDINKEIASATAVRTLLESGKDASDYTPCKGKAVFMSDFDMIVSARVKSASKEELCSVPDCNEDIAARILKAASHNTFSEIVSAASCKSYTQSRIRRILCNLIIGNRFSTLPVPSYIRPLGFNKTGGIILSKMKSTASLPVVARGALIKDNPIFTLECKATDIYNLARGITGGEEFRFVALSL